MGRVLWECYTYLRNVQDLLSDGENSIQKAFWITNYWTDHSLRLKTCTKERTRGQMVACPFVVNDVELVLSRLF